MLVGHPSVAQDVNAEKIRILWPPDVPGNSRQLVRAKLSQDLDYFVAVSAFQFLNWDHDKKNDHFVFLHSLKYQVLLAHDSIFSITGLLCHDLGFLFFTDSLTQVHPDETTCSVKVEWKIFRKTNLSFSTDLSSRLLNSIEYNYNENGTRVKVINAAFLEPGVIKFSLGFSHTWPGFGELRWGLSSAKLTCIRDKGIFDRLNLTLYNGIPKGRSTMFEYGMSLHLLIDRDLLRNLHWNCDLLLFRDYLSPIDFSLKNLFCLTLNKYIRISIQTRILYEEKVCKNLQLENHLNIGFSVHL